MKIETILDAMISAIVLGKANYYTDQDEYLAEKCYRQYQAFRRRIIRMDECNKKRIAELESGMTLLLLREDA